MRTITIKDLKEVIRHVAIRCDAPVFIWGPPGVGKTQALAQVAAEEGMFHVDVRLAQYDAVDMRGLPTREAGNNATVWLPPVTMPFVGNALFPTDKLILLTLDEMNTASPYIQAIAYQLINERRVGEHVLMDNVRVVAMGNREGDRGVTSKQPLPLANRFTHVELIVDRDEWIDYAIGVGLPEECVGFYMFRPALLSTFDPTKMDKAFATPRSSEVAWRYYGDAAMPLSVKQIAMAGAVGEGVAAEIWAFVKVWRDVVRLLPEILQSPSTAKVPTEASMQYALTTYLSGVACEHAEKGKLKTVLPAIDTYITRMTADFGATFWSLSGRRNGAVMNTPEFHGFVARNKNLTR